MRLASTILLCGFQPRRSSCSRFAREPMHGWLEMAVHAGLR